MSNVILACEILEDEIKKAIENQKIRILSYGSIPHCICFHKNCKLTSGRN